jgi:hypothetical protein
MIKPPFPWSEPPIYHDLQVGFALLGKRVKMRHLCAPNDPTYRVVALRSTGMIEIDRMSGEFAPHLFVLVEEEKLG